MHVPLDKDTESEPCVYVCIIRRSPVCVCPVPLQASKNGADIWVTRWVAGLIVSDTHTPQHTLLTQTHPQPPLTHVNALPGSARHVSESRGQSSVATLHTLVPALTSQANSWPWGLWSSGHTYQYVRDSEVLTNPISRITWAWPVQFRAVQFPTSLGIPTGLGAVLWRTSLGTQADATRHFLVGLAIITGQCHMKTVPMYH